MSSNTSLPILIIGAGVAGSVLAISLRQKGYEVILFEKYNGPAPGGASLNLAPNGLKVLNNLGLAKLLFSRGIAAPVEILSYRTHEKVLVNSDIPLAVKEHFGFPFAGVKRSVFLQYLLETVQAEGVDIRFGHALKDIDQGETSVLAKFENGQQVMGSILIGCDGLHSQTRITLFGQEIPEYTGLTQTAGLTRVSHHHRKMQNIFGDNIHMISYAVGKGQSDDNNNDSLISWAITRKEKEGRESWKTEDSDVLRKELIGQLHCEWDNGVLAEELVANAPAILKFGLYDRKELKTWYKDRVVLIGDAAHPTAPHLGQGANQALEDVKMLTELLFNHLPPSRFSTLTSIQDLNVAFETLNDKRISRTSTLVAKAREVGRLRVLPSNNVKAEKRNVMIREEWSQSNEILLQMYEKLFGYNSTIQ
ncbi:hypothetical protein Clacol_004699 [Clathrus columnatus]|uniref:FAD-binding domain-containing protein n=1 Tax=Clathrus columnatus TaxID=1419009 RepID=A0AAV5AAH0_9AGAM|nr:hypothetical protein Clacol_004699 [Clathrus columnatus]